MNRQYCCSVGMNTNITHLKWINTLNKLANLKQRSNEVKIKKVNEFESHEKQIRKKLKEKHLQQLNSANRLSKRIHGNKKRLNRKNMKIEKCKEMECSYNEIDAFDSDTDRDEVIGTGGLEFCVPPGYSMVKQFSKEMVTPAVYDSQGAQSLNKYLNHFERYFWNRYDGTERDCTRELSKFLTGKEKEVYCAIGGAHIKYPEMKQSLLQYDKANEYGKINENRQNFNCASMKSGESFTLYCMRLRRMAQIAYPKNMRGYLKKFKKKLIQSVPLSFVKKLEMKEELKVMLKQGKKINWNEIMDIAEMQDKYEKRLKLENNSVREKAKCDQLNEIDAVDDCTSNGNTDSGTVDADFQCYECKPSVAVPQCHYCGRIGHNANICWFLSGACTLCGNRNHSYRTCPRFKVPADFSPMCPRCGEQHLGKHCPNSS